MVVPVRQSKKNQLFGGDAVLFKITQCRIDDLMIGKLGHFNTRREFDADSRIFAQTPITSSLIFMLLFKQPKVRNCCDRQGSGDTGIFVCGG